MRHIVCVFRENTYASCLWSVCTSPAVGLGGLTSQVELTQDQFQVWAAAVIFTADPWPLTWGEREIHHLSWASGWDKIPALLSSKEGMLPASCLLSLKWSGSECRWVLLHPTPGGWSVQGIKRDACELNSTRTSEGGGWWVNSPTYIQQE